MFVATLFFLRRRQRRGGGKEQPGGGGGGGGGGLEAAPASTNDMKSEVNHSMTYSSITDPTTECCPNFLDICCETGDSF
ncbi:hypothetical protein O3P69_018903 [Scylla paramamosain]|uniref:Uncharacterized protein n=1 Tax=Scylla paramamosain TaxID=85552 RepID=A0AAW0SDL0_SCYPA